MPKITIDNLALMIQKGFEQTASKDDLKALDTKLSNRIDVLKDELKDEINAVKEHLTAYVGQHQQDYDHLDERVATVENDIIALHKLIPPKR